MLQVGERAKYEVLVFGLFVEMETSKGLELDKGKWSIHSIIQSLRRVLRFSVENWTEIDKTQLCVTGVATG